MVLYVSTNAILNENKIKLTAVSCRVYNGNPGSLVQWKENIREEMAEILLLV